MAPRHVMGAPYVSDGHCSASTAAAGTARGRHVPHPRHVFSPLHVSVRGGLAEWPREWLPGPSSGRDLLAVQTWPPACHVCVSVTSRVEWTQWGHSPDRVHGIKADGTCSVLGTHSTCSVKFVRTFKSFHVISLCCAILMSLTNHRNSENCAFSGA